MYSLAWLAACPGSWCPSSSLSRPFSERYDRHATVKHDLVSPHCSDLACKMVVDRSAVAEDLDHSIHEDVSSEFSDTGSESLVAPQLCV